MTKKASKARECVHVAMWLDLINGIWCRISLHAERTAQLCIQILLMSTYYAMRMRCHISHLHANVSRYALCINTQCAHTHIMLTQSATTRDEEETIQHFRPSFHVQWRLIAPFPFTFLLRLLNHKFIRHFSEEGRGVPFKRKFTFKSANSSDEIRLRIVWR